MTAAARRLPGLAVALARAANAIFFLLTATYCILTYSSFAYQQFIRTRMVSSLAEFVVFHHLWHWVLLGVTVATLLPEWRQSRGRSIAWAYVAAMAAVGLLLIYRPILPAVENDARGLWLACGFLLPPIWLAIYDHVSTSRDAAPLHPDGIRLVVAAAAAAAFAWLAHAVAAPLRTDELGDYTTSGTSLAFGAAVSLALHVGAFTLAAALLAVVLIAARRAGWSGWVQYLLIASAACAAALITVKVLVFGSLSFAGPAAWLLAAELAAVLTLTWSAIALRVAPNTLPLTAVELWIAPVPGARSAAPVALAMLVLVSGAEVWLLGRVETFDWNFLVQNLYVIGGWLMTVALVHAVVRSRAAADSRPMVLAALGVVAVAGVGAGGRIENTLPGSGAFVPEFALDAYAVLDPSYHLLRQITEVDPPGSGPFFAYLAANSLIQHVDVTPVDIEFTPHLSPAPVRPPHIFLFVIDSFRRDYLSPYNPRVSFTPAFDRFAREGYAFQRSFTRYGGTGLSMPAIWAGSLILHEQYVQPFAPMNALQKLLDANGYRPVMSMDHITAQIVSPSMTVDELDQGRDELQYDFCGTLGELESKLSAGLADQGPIFAHTRSLNLHVSKLTLADRVEVPEPSLAGFHERAALAVRRMDNCFGGFVDYLKTSGLYDNSIVIVTADHGDALGEARRWGHSYTLFPEIVRTPLLMHVPDRLRAGLTADVDAPAYSTDLTPTLYALLGYKTDAPQWPLGRSLFVAPGTDTTWRRRDPVLLVSSYGPVYGVLRDDGESLYIADGVNRRDYAYDLSQLKPVRVGVTAGMRSENRAFIRDRIERLAALYHFTPSS